MPLDIPPDLWLPLQYSIAVTHYVLAASHLLNTQRAASARYNFEILLSKRLNLDLDPGPAKQKAAVQPTELTRLVIFIIIALFHASISADCNSINFNV